MCPSHETHAYSGCDDDGHDHARDDDHDEDGDDDGQEDNDVIIYCSMHSMHDNGGNDDTEEKDHEESTLRIVNGTILLR